MATRAKVGAFVLNFNGRVTLASVKNFQLITHDNQVIHPRRAKQEALYFYTFLGGLGASAAAVRSRRQGRVHDGLPVPHHPIPGLPSKALASFPHSSCSFGGDLQAFAITLSSFDSKIACD
jgi:hypothetical protein